MKKILRLQCELLKEINKYENIVQERDKLIDWERVHISSCAKLGYLMAEKRGFDPVLAACACAVHDYGRIITGKQEGHAEAGYLPAKEFLERTGLFNEEDVEQISLAVRNHSKKAEVGSPLEEIVKDADVMDFYQYGYEIKRQDQKTRLDTLCCAQANNF
ncbi:MAG: HD domain-containing protein [Peptostreptococcaceae bacterium]|nr:HD domain-containing protein [Peptostreptococcaceae bacterium]HZK61480.1 HD domain-containing protein [Anaerovoracaceae bacterium]